MTISPSKRGFTLVEILIVVAIIAILASVALVGLGPVQRSGRDTRRVSDLRQVQNGLELYHSKCGFYPGKSQANTTCDSFADISGSWADLRDTLTNSALGISKVPNDPKQGQDYFYGSTTGDTYVIGALLENADAPALRDDIDGTVEGIDCDDSPSPVYCIAL